MPNGTIDPERDYVSELSKATGQSWTTLFSSRNDALEVQGKLSKKLKECTSADYELVVFGSLARREWTTGSDVDWTLLIDGQADTKQRDVARKIQESIKGVEHNGKPLQPPGTEGTFGNMAFSHDIVHHIGGQADTNHNTTQRILLLLEATALTAVNAQDDGPFDRTVRQVLDRYLRSDSNFHTRTNNESLIPRFLLNDIVRYWRTMCVDFAYKDWEQAGKKWAVRNIKLRTSRKLLFLSGLLMVFSCYKNDDLQRDRVGNGGYLLALQSHMLSFVRSTPLDIVVWTLEELRLRDECIAILDKYEEFLAIMNDGSARDHLGGLKEGEVYDDNQFLECRKISHELQSELTKICFSKKSQLQDFTAEYGVF